MVCGPFSLPATVSLLPLFISPSSYSLPLFAFSPLLSLPSLPSPLTTLSPLLSLPPLSPGHSDLTSRFTNVCIAAVEWVVHGVEPFTSNHTHYFTEGSFIPTCIAYDPRITAKASDVGFTRFLLRFFYQALVPVVKKVELYVLYVYSESVCTVRVQ